MDSRTTAADYTVTFTRKGEVNAAFVAREGQKYGVVIAKNFSSCSCPDAMYRARACKHIGMVQDALKSEAMGRLVERFEGQGFEVIPEQAGARLSLWLYDAATDTGREIGPEQLAALLATEMQTAQASAQAAA